MGTGIAPPSDTTTAALAHMQSAERLVYVSGGLFASAWLSSLNPDAESLARFYSNDKHRATTYAEMVDYVISRVSAGERVCFAVYGHPGIFAIPTHLAIARAREAGFEATMLPGVSAEDTLFTDLGIDPSTSGCASFEASDFLLYDRVPDTAASLVLWQPSGIGNLARIDTPNVLGFELLVERLKVLYSPTHSIVIYEASAHPLFPPTIVHVTLAEARPEHLTPMCTIYVPPSTHRTLNRTLAERLGFFAPVA